MPGRASGVWRAALWKRTMDPGWTFPVTRFVISDADKSFQSRLSPLAADGIAFNTPTHRLPISDQLRSELPDKADCHIPICQLHIIPLKGEVQMKITDTFLTTSLDKRIEKQAELHRRCILLLNAARAKR